MLIPSLRRVAALWRRPAPAGLAPQQGSEKIDLPDPGGLVATRAEPDLGVPPPPPPAPAEAAPAQRAEIDSAAIGTAPQPGASLRLPPPRRPGDISRRYTWEECYANLDMLWRHYGRRPVLDETNRPPSRVGSISYQLRFGTWTKTIRAFEAYRAGDRAAWPMTGDNRGNLSAADPAVRAAKSEKHRWRLRARPAGKVTPSLRYQVLARDNNRCTACGADPKRDPTVRLHVDHKIPIVKGGTTTLKNLRALCAECNLGKGARVG